MTKKVFKGPTGSYLTRALFYEQTLADKSSVLYTLKNEDHEGFPSLYRLYMEENDPTEYHFANKYLDGWAHWEALCECIWFKPLVERWRKEIALRIKAEALKRIALEAKSTSKNAFSANRFLVSEGWVEKTESTTKRGRPSKKELEDTKKEILSKDQELNEILQRLN